jgi:hypothetical protein
MMLLMVGTFTFKQEFPEAYQRFKMFFCQYEVFVIILKVIVDSLLSIPYYQDRFLTRISNDGKMVKFYCTLFGIEVE